MSEDRTFITETGVKGKSGPKTANPKAAFRAAIRDEDPEKLVEAINALRQTITSEDEIYSILDEALLMCSKAGQANLVEVLAAKGADVNTGEFILLINKELLFNGL